MTLWILRRVRCWWKGCDLRPTFMPFGRDGAPVQVGSWCLWCTHAEVWPQEEWR